MLVRLILLGLRVYERGLERLEADPGQLKNPMARRSTARRLDQ